MSETTKQGVHISSIRLLVVVWVALMIGTWLTVTATYVDLGPLNIWIGLAIATVKAVLVALYYMHLRWDRPFNGFVFLTAFLFLGIFVGIALMDTSHYQDEIISNFATAVGSAAHAAE
jgi:cytochrome c oxidase subunit 4